MQGYDVVLTTGTDEHGQKIERAAKAVGKSEQEFIDVIANEFREQWKGLACFRRRYVAGGNFAGGFGAWPGDAGAC